MREYGIHRTLRHASIVALTDLFEIDAAAFATVLERCPGGDLDAHLQRHQACSWSQTLYPSSQACSTRTPGLAPNCG